MEKIKNFLNNNKSILLIAFIIIFTLSLPLMQNNLVIGDDYDYHISRIQSITESLKNSIFPVKIHPQLANSYGYGSGLFYPNLFIYIPALIHLFGLNLILSYKIFIFIMLCFMFLLIYFSLKNITEDKYSALIGTILIMLSKNLILNLYYRFALGEFLGFIFIIPVISGIYDYVHKDFKKPYLLFIGFLGLINTHIITTLICLIFCILYFLLNIKSTIEQPKKLLKLLLTALLVVLLSSCFWLPMIEQLSSQTFKLSIPWTHIGDDEYRLIDLFGTTKYSIGLVITLFMPLLIYGILDKNISKKTKSFCIWTILIIILIVNFTFWKLTNKYTNIIQFKWRLVGILTIISSIAISLLIKEYSVKFNLKINVILLVILIFAICLSIQFLSDDKKINHLITLEKLESNMYQNPTSIGGGTEYLPVEVDYSTLNTPTQAISNTGEKIDIIKTNLRCEFYKNNSERSWYDIPYIYYYGYVANIKNDLGETLPLEVTKSNSGLVRVIIPENTNGTISIWYNGTKIQKISYIISLSTLFILFLFILTRFIFKKRKK